MAEESDLERTEPASGRRLEKAREEGNVPQSRELGTLMVLIAGLGTLWAMGSWLSLRVLSLLREGLTLTREMAFEPSQMFLHFMHQSGEALITLAPLFLFTVAGAIVAPIVIGGWNFTGKPLQPDFSRMNPLSGIKRIFSVRGVAELVKAVLKSLVVGLVIWWVIRHEQDNLFSLITMPVETGMPEMVKEILWASVMIVGGMALIAAIDVPFQLWQYYKKLRMTKEEVKQEGKEQEGSPEVKGRIRRQQRELARRRMMQEVPKADVVVTNPTHFAVALKYDSSRMSAPQVVAKGMNLVAAHIREIAESNRVPVLEAPPLARALYKHAELGDQVPSALYTAVAEVMAYVYQLGQYLNGAQGMAAPEAPRAIAVPAALDP
ncbi:MAG TPA: flagellar biosynthesis protein FlhB, partial [Rhodocyclaceae bacterium]|nr:flagellar biosynthesis protein FlhB [Rhodocyclaceae bacterium]